MNFLETKWRPLALFPNVTNTNKTFNVFGDPVEVRAAAAVTGGGFSAVVQTCQPGGGPPPHWHDSEDEFFVTLEGEFEMFDGQNWHTLPKDQSLMATRGNVHTFRNSGSGEGKILCIAIPGRLDEYLAEISPIQKPQDAGRLVEISDRYGIHFVGMN